MSFFEKNERIIEIRKYMSAPFPLTFSANLKYMIKHTMIKCCSFVTKNFTVSGEKYPSDHNGQMI